jgi:hypothetical protein
MRIVICAMVLAGLPTAVAARSKAANYLVAEQIAGGGAAAGMDSPSPPRSSSVTLAGTARPRFICTLVNLRGKFRYPRSEPIA